MTFHTHKVFNLAEFTVDISRGEIRYAELIHSIEPKVMAVLLLLVEHAGEVVAQEDIFEQVWPNSIYNPSSIQRCIAILRKAFNDDAKSQSIIVTHPKRGYSLNIKPEALIETYKTTGEKTHLLAKFVWLSAAIFILLIMLLMWNRYYRVPTFDIVEMSPIIASELNDSLPLYSPNNQYIAFFRTGEDNTGNGHIWLKAVDEEDAFQLSVNSDKVLSLTWSSDSSAIIYTARDGENVKINRLNLAEGQSNATNLFVLDNVKSTSTIHWHVENKLYFLAQYQQEKKLYSVDIATGQQQQLTAHNEDFKPYQIALSKNNKKLAILGFNQNFETVVKILTLSTQRLEDIGAFDKNIYSVSWHPDGEKLLFSDGRQLLLMALNGQQSKIEFENYSYIQSPNFTPDGKAIALMLARSDSDLWQSSVNQPALDNLIVNSKNLDWGASISPNATQLAFISERKGYPQLYLYSFKSGKSQLIYENKQRHLYLTPPVWHPTKDIVASAVSDKPLLITLSEQNVEITEFDQAFGQPVQFYRNQQALLLLEHTATGSRLVRFGLDKKSITPLTSAADGWGHLLNDSTLLLVSGHQISVLNEQQQIRVLQQVEGEIIHSVLKENQLYVQINTPNEKAIWQYSFALSAFTKVTVLPDNTDSFWDIDNDSLLLETLSIEQDIVLLQGTEL